MEGGAEMTAPRPWPTKAAQARADAIRMAGEIVDWADDGRRHVRNVDLVLADIRGKALEIKATLLECPHIEEGGVR